MKPNAFIIGLLLGGAVVLSGQAYKTWRAGAVQLHREAPPRNTVGRHLHPLKEALMVGWPKSREDRSSHPARLFAAIAAVESGGDDNAVNTAEGAVGRYQIRECYYKDALDYMSRHREECLRNPEIAEGIMEAYWLRYGCRSDEEKVRCHNGGPQGMEKAATLPYWRKVRNALCVSVAK